LEFTTLLKTTPNGKSGGEVLLEALNDPSPTVRVAAAHALCDWGELEKGLTVLAELLRHQKRICPTLCHQRT
jgi:HEAT repeat protein